jgi:tryptophanyl-tRNA synthetase
LLNRAHAYKAAVDQNTAKGEDPDASITAGLYMYPVLMAADILMFNADKVPVGRDQVQHVEMTRDIGQRFNHIYGTAWRAAGGKGEPFTLPEAMIEASVATLPGLDGRKMSKSYDNTVPLFEGGAKALREAIARIVTDSREPGESKDPDSSSLFAIYRAFAGDAESATFRAELEDGIGWGDAKQKLFERIDAEIAPLRERYDALMARPADIEDALRDGAEKARAVASPRLEIMRRAVGLGALAARSSQFIEPNDAQPKVVFATPKIPRAPTFKQYRGPDGLFYFKLVDGDGSDLFISNGFETGRSAAQEKHYLSSMVSEEASALSEGSASIPINGGYRFEIRDPEGNLMFGAGPVVSSKEESSSLRERFLQALRRLKN